MSTSVLPSIAGLTFPASRTPIFATRKQSSISGKETRIADWSYPRYQWTLQFSVLRQGAFAGASYTEMAQLEGFFEALQGGFDSFLYTDPDDNAVSGQALGTGDGSKTVFPLTRTFGGTNAPILAPNTVSAVYLNGVSQLGSSYTVTPWGTSNSNGPGQLIFNTAPGSTVAVTADFSYYFPCRFDDDKIDFERFMQSLYALKKLSFTSIK